jgi:hypothetical protein
MIAPDRRNALDHVVVVMFENRSFDNLLGRLYEPGEVKSFEDVIGKDLSNPVPSMPEALFELDAPLGDLGYALVSGAVALARSFGKSAPDTKADPSMPGEQALALAREALGHVFPLLLRGER